LGVTDIKTIPKPSAIEVQPAIRKSSAEIKHNLFEESKNDKNDTERSSILDQYGEPPPTNPNPNGNGKPTATATNDDYTEILNTGMGYLTQGISSLSSYSKVAYDKLATTNLSSYVDPKLVSSVSESIAPIAESTKQLSAQTWSAVSSYWNTLYSDQPKYNDNSSAQPQPSRNEENNQPDNEDWFSATSKKNDVESTKPVPKNTNTINRTESVKGQKDNGATKKGSSDDGWSENWDQNW